jgi:arginyl-tRNA synthetase
MKSEPLKSALLPPIARQLTYPDVFEGNVAVWFCRQPLNEMSTLTADGLHCLLRANGVDEPIPDIPGLDPCSSLISVYTSYLTQVIIDASGCDASVALKAIQWPNEPGMGDLVIVTPRLRLEQNQSDKVLEQVGAKTAALLPLFGRPLADGIHQRVFINGAILQRLLLPYILDRGPCYGVDWQRDRGTILVEFSSPNLGKDFDGNHLRSTIHGSFIASLYERRGYEVHRVNFLGDWGKHIGILAEGWVRFGSEERLESSPLAHLLACFHKADELLKAERLMAEQSADRIGSEQTQVNAAVTIDISAKSECSAPGEASCNGQTLAVHSVSVAKDAFFKALEDGDQNALELWRRFRCKSIDAYVDLYKQMNICFDEYCGESDVSSSTIAEVEKILIEEGAYAESGDAWIIDFRKLGFKHLGTAITRYRNGTTSYLLRDIAAAVDRGRIHNFEKMVYVVTSRQEIHFQQVFKALELMHMPELAAKLQHVSFGKVTGLKTNVGSAGLLLEDMLANARETIENLVAVNPACSTDLDPSAAGTLGVIALACQDLAGKRGGTFTYEPNLMASMEGWTGLTLHIWLRRLTLMTKHSVIVQNLLADQTVSYDLLVGTAYEEPMRLLLEFPHVVSSATKTLESMGLVIYLYRLTDLLPTIMDDQQGQGSSDFAHVKSALLECLRIVLSTGMRILGLDGCVDV